MSNLQVVDQGPVRVVTISRVDVRNAVDEDTAVELEAAITDFDRDPDVSIAVLTGAGDTFCSGADLKAIAIGEVNRIETTGRSPLGPTRMTLSKPVIAAIEGHAVAGGLELAIWCDLRIAARDAVFGVYCRRFGVPLVDMGTVRLPRLIGHGRAMDLILTGRDVGAEEALAMGLVNRVVAPGQALDAAVALARDLADLPQTCLRNDRLSVIEQWSLTEADAAINETRRGLETIRSGETLTGAAAFSHGAGRHGEPVT